MYVHEKKYELLFLVVHVDDYLYAGSRKLAEKFEKFLQEEFKIGSTEISNFTIMGAQLTQDDSETITLDAKEKLLQIKPLLQEHRGKRDIVRNATDKEITAYRSVIGKVLYIGKLERSYIAFHASNASKKRYDLSLYHL